MGNRRQEDGEKGVRDTGRCVTWRQGDRSCDEGPEPPFLDGAVAMKKGVAPALKNKQNVEQ